MKQALYGLILMACTGCVTKKEKTEICTGVKIAYAVGCEDEAKRTHKLADEDVIRCNRGGTKKVLDSIPMCAGNL